MPDGTWPAFANFYDDLGERADYNQGRYIWPYGYWDDDNLLRDCRENIDGGYTLLPLVLAMDDPANNVLGELDGCYWISGVGNAAENNLKIDGTDHLVVPNVFRSARYDYWALRLA